LENQIKNVKGQSTSSEVAPEYFGAKRRLSLKRLNGVSISLSLVVGAAQPRKKASLF